MNLRAQTHELRSPLRPGDPPRQPFEPGSSQAAYHDLRDRLHTQLLGRIDLEVMGAMKSERLREELGILVEQLLLVLDIQYEVLGLGPLEPLLADPTVSDILVNGPHQVSTSSGAASSSSPTWCSSDDDHLMKIIDKIVSRIGRRIDESSPMVDARLPDGSRVNAIIPPLAMTGRCCRSAASPWCR
jgi:pilus assembly protein CpaF